MLRMFDGRGSFVGAVENQGALILFFMLIVKIAGSHMIPSKIDPSTCSMHTFFNRWNEL